MHTWQTRKKLHNTIIHGRNSATEPVNMSFVKRCSLQLPQSPSIMSKNLQVVSFDSDWREVYLGVVKRDVFAATCVNSVPSAAQVRVTYNGPGGQQDKDEGQVQKSSGK